MLFRSLRMILLGAALVCLMPSVASLAGENAWQTGGSHSHKPHERQHRLTHPAPRAAVVESTAIRRVARPQQEDAQRPENLEDRVTKLENNFKQLNGEVSRLADLLQRQIDILDKTR